MRSFTEYERAIRALFLELEMPVEGITYTWLCKLKALSTLISEAEVLHPSFPVVVDEIAANLRGSAAYTWASRELLEQMRQAIGTIEGHMREFDHIVYGAPLLIPNQERPLPPLVN